MDVDLKKENESVFVKSEVTGDSENDDFSEDYLYADVEVNVKAELNEESILINHEVVYLTENPESDQLFLDESVGNFDDPLEEETAPSPEPSSSTPSTLKKRRTGTHYGGLDGGYTKNAKLKFSCYHCPYRAADKGVLRSHIIRIHISGLKDPFVTSLIGAEIKSIPSELPDLYCLTRQKKTFICPHCDAVYKQSSHLTAHINVQHTGERPYKCPRCESTFAHIMGLKWHIKSKHKELRPFTCPYCDFSGRSTSEVMSHIRSNHTKIRPFLCELCEYCGNSTMNLKRHFFSKHKNEYCITCPNCAFICLKMSDLEEHLSNACRMFKKNRKKSSFTCSFCGFQCSKNIEIVDHTVSEHPSFEISSCNECDFRCLNMLDLKAHVARKHKPMGVICSLCNKSCSSTNSLKRHIRCVHGTEKPYVCSFCQKAFNQKVNLKTHIFSRHSDNKNKTVFKCHLCDFSSYFIANIKRHNLIKHKINNQNKKLLSCPHCDYTAYYSSCIKRHLETHKKQQEATPNLVS